MTGVITSTKMTKALIVTVYSTKLHSKYQKRYKSRKKYAASCSDTANFRLGQTVEIMPCAPVSRTIRFKVVENVAVTEEKIEA